MCWQLPYFINRASLLALMLQLFVLSLLRLHSRAFSLRTQWRRACGHSKMAPTLPPLLFPDMVS